MSEPSPQPDWQAIYNEAMIPRVTRRLSNEYVEAMREIRANNPPRWYPGIPDGDTVWRYDHPPKNVAVAISSGIRDPKLLKAAFHQCGWNIGEITCMADCHMAVFYAEGRGIPIHLQVGYWHPGEADYPQTNLELLQRTDAVLALWRGENGPVKHLIQLAISRDKPVRIVRPWANEPLDCQIVDENPGRHVLHDNAYRRDIENARRDGLRYEPHPFASVSSTWPHF